MLKNRRDETAELNSIVVQLPGEKISCAVEYAVADVMQSEPDLERVPVGLGAMLEGFQASQGSTMNSRQADVYTCFSIEARK